MVLKLHLSTSDGPWEITDFSALRSERKRLNSDNAPAFTFGQVAEMANRNDPLTEHFALTLQCKWITYCVFTHHQNGTIEKTVRVTIEYKLLSHFPQLNWDILQADVTEMKQQLRLLIARVLKRVPNDTPNYKSLKLRVVVELDLPPMLLLSSDPPPFFTGQSYLDTEGTYFHGLNGGGLSTVRLLLFTAYFSGPTGIGQQIGQRLLKDFEALSEEHHKHTVSAEKENQGWKNACEVLSAAKLPAGVLEMIRSCFTQPLKFEKITSIAQ